MTGFLARDWPQILGFAVWIPGVFVGARIYYRSTTMGHQRTRDVSKWNWEELMTGLFVGLFWPLILLIWLIGLAVAWNPREKDDAR